MIVRSSNIYARLLAAHKKNFFRSYPPILTAFSQIPLIALTHTYTNSLMHTHTHVHTLTNAHTHTYTHSLVHTRKQSYIYTRTIMCTILNHVHIQ